MINLNDGPIVLDESTQETKEIIEQWRAEASQMTQEELPEFIRHLTEDYEHDYGTICHAMSCASIAAMWAVDKSPQGGITGFQAGAIMWENIQNWMTEYRGKPLKLVNYSDMIYPQYQYKFEKTISRDNWEYLQKEAQKNLDESEHANEEVKEHWRSIVDGIVPFDYEIED